MAVSITIRNVPHETRDELAARAARKGQSMQDYLRALLLEMAEKPDEAMLIERIREAVHRKGSHLTAD